MGIFNRKKVDDEYEEVEEVVVRRRPKSEAFKDLKSENRKKRKEPPKPWGKKERILVLIIIILTAGTSTFLSLSARAWKLPGLPRLKVPQLNLPFFGEETIILEGNKESGKDKQEAERITSAFRERTRELSGVYGLSVIKLESGYSYGVNENETFQAASLIKLPIIAAMYMEAEKGNLDLDSKYSLKNSDKISGAGSLYLKPAGYEITYRNLINLMGKQSDNTAFNVCRKFLGDEKINEVIKKIGMTHTSLDNNETTPRDIGIFFEGLWKGNIVSKVNRDEILDDLTGTVYENWLVAGIPEGVRVAHKYGREVHVVNDAGIVFTDKPFIVVIMSKGVIEREADEILPELSRIVYEIGLN